MPHDLHDYMAQLSTSMQAEYERIRRNARSDPGTAGDEGEENWAQLLRSWLPVNYRVVTKGQLLSATGELSPQLDILVLKPTYPPFLEVKKKYLAAAVAAVFECKLTLRPSHLKKVLSNAAAVKRLYGRPIGTPRDELVVGPVFGLLAHSHDWSTKRGPTEAIEVISEALRSVDAEVVNHPREMLDLLCISNLATWSTEKQPLFDPQDEYDEETRAALNPRGEPATSYMCHAGSAGFLAAPNPTFKPIGAALATLLVKLAWNDPALREIALYFMTTDLTTSWSGKSRHWTRAIYSPELRRRLTLKRLTRGLEWNDWGACIE